MDIRLLALYFVIGGIAVASASYFGSRGEGTIAALIAILPSITAISLCTIYFSGGIAAATSYVKGMMFMILAWIPYAVSLFYLLPRLGLAPSLTISLSVYVSLGFLITRLIH